MTTTILFDGTLGTLPVEQGELFLAQILPPPFTPPARERLVDNRVTVDTDFVGDGSTGLLGYTNHEINFVVGQIEPINPAFPPLDSSAGFTLSFNLEISEETSIYNNEAGFSVIVVSSDSQNEIELGFGENRIFTQGQGFVSAEEVEFDTTSPTDYELKIEGREYALLADGEEILSGPLRNYDFDPATSNPPLPDNPYERPNFIFLGDGTNESSATFSLGSVEVGREEDSPTEPPEPPEPNPVALKVTYYNLAPEEGTVLSPMWVGFHDGTFDIYEVGSPAPERLERLAEDANSAILSSDFIESGAGLVSDRIEGTFGPFNAVSPGESASEILILDAADARSRYFSYGAMVVPSNDAFIANNNPLAYEIFDAEGNFIGADFIIERVYDAGVEVNDEVPENTAFLAQTEPNTGEDENGVVGLHPGFMPEGNILTAFPGADITAPDYQVARIKIELVDTQNSFPVRNQINGTPEDDTAIGTPLDDEIRGLPGNDILRGEGGNDLLLGGQDADNLSGGIGNDLLLGGPGNDLLDGGPGDDVISGSAGRDLMLGGNGADIFILSTDSAADRRIEADVIVTFEVGIDSIGLTGGLTVEDLDLEQLGTNTLIKIAANGQILGIVNRVLVEDLEGSFLSV